MNHSDFDYIKYFTAHEVETTGADLGGVEYETIHMLDRARSIIGWPIKLMKNGLTTGNHSSTEHPEGRAVDFACPGGDPVKVALALSLVGFHGIGVYRNHRGAYSFHADRRQSSATWYGTKSSPRSQWAYKQLKFEE